MSELTNDQQTSVQSLKDEIAQFVAERDWNQFHSPKNLSMSMAIEAAELMEHFQWIGTEDSRNLSASAVAEVGEELADVVCYSLAMANQLEIDLTQTIRDKMIKNRKKYPADEFRGRFGKSQAAAPVVTAPTVTTDTPKQS